MSWWKILIGDIPGAVKDVVMAREQRKQRKEELEDAKHQRRIEVIQQGRVNEATWNQRAIENAGWRDEYLTIVLSAPLILVFFPWFVPYIREGFLVLETLPDWYKAALAVMIGSAFGYQKYVHYQMTRAYSLPEEEEALEEEREK